MGQLLTPGERYVRPSEDDEDWPGVPLLRRFEVSVGDIPLLVETKDGYEVAGVLEEVGHGILQVGPHRFIYDDITAFRLIREPPIDPDDELRG